jgi:hypothetical protein
LLQSSSGTRGLSSVRCHTLPGLFLIFIDMQMHA